MQYTEKKEKENRALHTMHESSQMYNGILK